MTRKSPVTPPAVNVDVTLRGHVPARMRDYAVEKIGHDSTFTTHSFQFFDNDGDAAFKAFLWEDFPNVPAGKIALFHDLTRRFAEG